MNQELPDVQAAFRKGKGTRDQIANIPLDHRKSKRTPEKHLLLLHWLSESLWLCGSQQMVENSYTRPPWPPPAKPECRTRSKSQNRTWNNGLVPNSEREYSNAVYCHPAYLSYISGEMSGWRKRKPESRLLGEISISHMQMTPSLWQRKEKGKWSHSVVSDSLQPHGL